MAQRKMSKKTITTLISLMIALLVGIGVITQPADSVQVSPGMYRVVKVIDGDTLDVQAGEEKLKLRLIGINTPETVDPRKPVECFGKEASNRAKTLLNNKEVKLEYDNSQDKLDKYGRTLAYIVLPDGTNFNKKMIEDGYAYEYTYERPYKYQEEFKAAQRQAEMQKLGLWAEGTCVN